MTPLTDRNSVAILLCTFNGAEYLRPQIDSIIAQEYQNWVLYVFDDGSSDNTLTILSEYHRKLGSRKFKIHSGPKKGYAKNFHLACRKTATLAEYFAFADQDDVWIPTKLSEAIENLQYHQQNSANLYATRTQLIGDDGRMLGLSKMPKRPVKFENAILENVAGGNTMVFNKALAKLFIEIPENTDIISHDWTLYQLVTATGGNFVFSKSPSVLYRQHQLNSVGANNNFFAKFSRLLSFFRGNYKYWISVNCESLSHVLEHFEPSSRETIENLIKVRKGNFRERLGCLKKRKVYRQHKLESLLVYIGIIFRKV